MKVNLECALESHQTEGRRQRIFAGPRSVIILMVAFGIGLLMMGVVSALTSYQAFHTTEEQVSTGTDTSGTYTDTFTAGGSYRVIQEEYAGDEARTQADTPSSFTTLATYTNVINFTPYTMPVEGGFIYRIGIYIFEVGDGETEIRLALYEDIEDRPRSLLTQTAPLTATATGWLWFDIEPQLVPGDSRYWLAYQANDGGAELGWKWAPPSEGYRFLSWTWGPFPTLVGTSSGPILRRTCYQVAYTTTQDALDVGYTIPVPTALDGYTLTVRGATSGEPFYVTADGQAVGTISYAPTAQDFFSDDMESGSGGWTANNFTYIVAGSGYYSSPTHVWWTEDVPYGSSASLTSVPITLPFSTHDLELRFWHRMISEHNYDGGWVEYRTQENGTWSSWLTITDTMFIQGEYNSVLMRVPSGPHAAWSRTHNGVVRIRMPATTAGHLVQWRWVFECDVLGGEPAEEPDGWWIDDVLVLGKTSDDVELVFPLSLSLVSDGQVTVQFQDAITDSNRELLGIDLIEVTGMLYNRPPAVTVTAPNGGEYWGGTQTVEWTGSDPNGDVITYNVYLSTNGGVTWTTSLYQVSYAETEALTTRSWTGFDTTAFDNSENCLIRIQASDGDASDSDETDTAFAIDNITPSVTLTAPDGGEILQGGTSYAITWNASDDHLGPLPIALYYSTDGGATFPSTISGATENDGSFTWSVPEIDNTHVQVRVVATDLAGHSSHDDSDADFVVDSTAPSVALTAPDGGETLQGGTSYAITWNASDTNFGLLPIALYYSTDGGATFPFAISGATENDGSFTWSVPEIDNTHVQVRVVATDLAGHSSHDDSDADFAIDSTSPDGSVVIDEGDYTTARDIHLTLDAPADTAEMYIDGDLINASNVRQWIAYTTAASVTVTTGEGSKTVTVHYRDLAANESDPISDTVIYDATAPTITGKTPGDGSTITTGTPVISANLADDTSGIDPATIAMTVDGSLVTHNYNPGSGLVSYTPTPALTNATHVVTISVRDRASHPVSETWSFSVNEPPASVSVAADPMRILPDGVSIATITATVRGSSGHPVVDGTQVTFTTTMGTLAGGAVDVTTTHDGVATTVLTASTTEGKATITASAGEAEGTTDVLFTTLLFPSYLPSVFNGYTP